MTISEPAEAAAHLTEQCCLIVGAGGGVGTALCRQLAKAGWRIAAVGRSADGLARLREQVDPAIQTFVCDATDLEALHRVVSDARSVLGRLDGAVNCAGSILLKPAHLTAAQEFSATIASNLTTAFSLVSAASKAMLGDGGSIVLVSSAAARVGLSNQEAIAAAKAGVAGLALSAAATYARYRIRVNCVAPGLVQTPLSERLLASEASRNASLALHPLGRLGEPDDVAAAIAWLLDWRQSWVTGQVIGVDGGLASVRGRN